MKDYKKLIPAKYREHIYDFYHDEDGWWIELKEDCPYHFAYSYAEYTIHEDTQKQALEEFKLRIAPKEN